MSPLPLPDGETESVEVLMMLPNKLVTRLNLECRCPPQPTASCFMQECKMCAFPATQVTLGSKPQALHNSNMGCVANEAVRTLYYVSGII